MFDIEAIDAVYPSINSNRKIDLGLKYKDQFRNLNYLFDKINISNQNPYAEPRKAFNENIFDIERQKQSRLFLPKKSRAVSAMKERSYSILDLSRQLSILSNKRNSVIINSNNNKNNNNTSISETSNLFTKESKSNIGNNDTINNSVEDLNILNKIKRESIYISNNINNKNNDMYYKIDNKGTYNLNDNSSSYNANKKALFRESKNKVIGSNDSLNYNINTIKKNKYNNQKQTAKDKNVFNKKIISSTIFYKEAASNNRFSMINKNPIIDLNRTSLFNTALVKTIDSNCNNNITSKRLNSSVFKNKNINNLAHNNKLLMKKKNDNKNGDIIHDTLNLVKNVSSKLSIDFGTSNLSIKKNDDLVLSNHSQYNNFQNSNTNTNEIVIKENNDDRKSSYSKHARNIDANRELAKTTKLSSKNSIHSKVRFKQGILNKQFTKKEVKDTDYYYNYDIFKRESKDYKQSSYYIDNSTEKEFSDSFNNNDKNIKRKSSQFIDNNYNNEEHNLNGDDADGKRENINAKLKIKAKNSFDKSTSSQYYTENFGDSEKRLFLEKYNNRKNLMKKENISHHVINNLEKESLDEIDIHKLRSLNYSQLNISNLNSASNKKKISHFNDISNSQSSITNFNFNNNDKRDNSNNNSNNNNKKNRFSATTKNINYFTSLNYQNQNINNNTSKAKKGIMKRRYTNYNDANFTIEMLSKQEDLEREEYVIKRKTLDYNIEEGNDFIINNNSIGSIELISGLNKDERESHQSDMISKDTYEGLRTKKLRINFNDINITNDSYSNKKKVKKDFMRKETFFTSKTRANNLKVNYTINDKSNDYLIKRREQNKIREEAIKLQSIESNKDLIKIKRGSKNKTDLNNPSSSRKSDYKNNSNSEISKINYNNNSATISKLINKLQNTKYNNGMNGNKTIKYSDTKIPFKLNYSNSKSKRNNVKLLQNKLGTTSNSNKNSNLNGNISNNSNSQNQAISSKSLFVQQSKINMNSNNIKTAQSNINSKINNKKSSISSNRSIKDKDNMHSQAYSYKNLSEQNYIIDELKNCYSLIIDQRLTKYMKLKDINIDKNEHLLKMFDKKLYKDLFKSGVLNLKNKKLISRKLRSHIQVRKILEPYIRNRILPILNILIGKYFSPKDLDSKPQYKKQFDIKNRILTSMLVNVRPVFNSLIKKCVLYVKKNWFLVRKNKGILSNALKKQLKIKKIYIDHFDPIVDGRLERGALRIKKEYGHFCYNEYKGNYASHNKDLREFQLKNGFNKKFDREINN